MAAPKTQITRVNYNEVRLDLEKAFPTKFNTSFHTADEAPDLSLPSEAPYSFKRWLPLILDSRNLSVFALQTVVLSPPQARLLVRAAAGSIITGSINRMYAEDIEDRIAPVFSSLIFPPEGLFMRLDACSAKDGAQKVPGRASIHSVDEAILRLVTSTRASNAFTTALEDGVTQLEIFFLPFNTRMRSEREYRVFCPPGGDRITGISQYRWHKPWLFSDVREEKEVRRIVEYILSGVKQLHKAILGELRREDQLDILLLQQGFSFDVFFDEELEICELVELNVFGVRSACGSCLFQWVKDRDQLYGQQPGPLEFRVTF